MPKADMSLQIGSLPAPQPGAVKAEPPEEAGGQAVAAPGFSDPAGRSDKHMQRIALRAPWAGGAVLGLLPEVFSRLPRELGPVEIHQRMGKGNVADDWKKLRSRALMVDPQWDIAQAPVSLFFRQGLVGLASIVGVRKTDLPRPGYVISLDRPAVLIDLSGRGAAA